MQKGAEESMNSWIGKIEFKNVLKCNHSMRMLVLKDTPVVDVSQSPDPGSEEAWEQHKHTVVLACCALTAAQSVVPRFPNPEVISLWLIGIHGGFFFPPVNFSNCFLNSCKLWHLQHPVAISSRVQLHIVRKNTSFCLFLSHLPVSFGSP